MSAAAADWLPRMIRREVTVDAVHGEVFTIGGRDVPATAARDVALPVRVAPFGRLDYPDCPDCGGSIEYAEWGRVPGSRECAECGSQFADTAYSVAVFRGGAEAVGRRGSGGGS